MSTEASDSTALSCCASTPRWAILNADTAAVTLISRISPSGTRLTIPAVTACTRASAVSASGEDRDREPDRERDRQHDQPQQQPIVGSLERRARVTKGARGRGQPLGAAVWTDRRRLEQRRPLDRERARPHRLAGAPHDRTRTRRSGWPRPARARRPTPPSRRRPPGRRPPGARGLRRPRPSTGTRRSTPSRTTTASGATSAASRSSARLERIS